MELETEEVSADSAICAPPRRIESEDGRRAGNNKIKGCCRWSHPCSKSFHPNATSLFFFILIFAWVSGIGNGLPYGENPSMETWSITCYTCMNVSNNDECNRYAIDRPCPEGRDFCLTLHVMEGYDADRSVLVNKRCAPLEDCTGDSTGCTTAYGQTQCVSCCDQPYCNDYVPINHTNAIFQRSAACGINAVGDTWRVSAVLTMATLIVILPISGNS